MGRSKGAGAGDAATAHRRGFCSTVASGSQSEGNEEPLISAPRPRLRLLSEPPREAAQGAAAITSESNEELRKLIRALKQRHIANAPSETDELPPAA